MAMSGTSIDPDDPPAIVEVFSNSARAWFVALVFSIKDETLVLRFINESGTKLQKLASCRDPRVVNFGTHTDGMLPPGVSRVASNTRPGECAYLYAATKQKFGTPALAWQAYLERELLEGEPFSMPGSPTQSEVPLHHTPQSAVSSSSSAAAAPAMPVQSIFSSSPFEPVLPQSPESQGRSSSPLSRRALEVEFARSDFDRTSAKELVQAKQIHNDVPVEKGGNFAPQVQVLSTNTRVEASARASPSAPKVDETREIDFGFSCGAGRAAASNASAATYMKDANVQPGHVNKKAYYTVGYSPPARSTANASAGRPGSSETSAASAESLFFGRSPFQVSAQASGASISSQPSTVGLAKPSGAQATADLVAACAAEAARAAEMARAIANKVSGAVSSKVSDTFRAGVLLLCRAEAQILARSGSEFQAIDIVQPGTILMATGGTEIVNNRTFVSVAPCGVVQLDLFEERHDPRTTPPELEPPKFDDSCSALVIWLHGLNGSSDDWLKWQNVLKKRLPWVQFCFPNAPLRPVSCQRGRCMQAWFDLPELPVTASEEMQGHSESIATVHRLLGRAMKNGFHTSRILLGGLCQGATLALQIGLAYEISIAGICALSGWVPQNLIPGIRQVNLPVFMGHGDRDQVVPMALAQRSAQCLAQAGCSSVQFMKYQGLSHAFVTAELDDVEQFFRANLPMRPCQKA